MPRKPAQPRRFESAEVVERHAALGATEVVLIKRDGHFGPHLITPRDDGSFVVDLIGGWHAGKEKAARRMMDMHAGIVTAQRSLGLASKRA